MAKKPPGGAMKIALALPILLAALAGCATQDPQQVAQADCKVASGEHPRSAVGKAGPQTDLDRKWAQAQLASSGYRRQELTRMGDTGMVESALRDCARN
jgi:hypothetical protein